MTSNSRLSSDEHMPTSHTTTLHESHGESKNLSSSTPVDTPPKEKSEKSESSSTSVHSSASSPSGTRNPSRVDLGAGDEKEGKESGGDLEVGKEDVIIVDWDGPDDPCNPRNWSFRKKWAATVIVSAFTFISPVSSSMVAPASFQIADQFGIRGEVEIAMVTSVFVLAYAIGPLFLGPLSELYGRSHVLQASNIFYLIWNLACGFAQNKQQLIAFRFLAGLGGSAPLSIGGGVLGDCWAAHERGQAIALYSLAPLLGPALGPLVGAWIAERSTWRWVFWSTSIADGIIQVLGLFYLRETFAPVLLGRRAAKIRKRMGIEEGDNARVRTPFDGEGRHWKHLFAKAIVRPFALFAREPIIQLLGIYMAFVYGLIYLILTTIPTIFTQIYGQSIGISGLNYIALGVGLTGASQVNARMMDRIYKYLTERSEKMGKGGGRPEFRLPSMVPGTIFLPVGLLITGWTVENRVHWIAPDIGIAFVGAGMILNFQSIQTYVIDAFTLHAASALAAVSCLRSLAGFGFPLFAPAMYNALGYGKGDTILAVFAIVVGCPAPWLFWHYGERIRSKSRYAGNS